MTSEQRRAALSQPVPPEMAEKLRRALGYGSGDKDTRAKRRRREPTDRIGARRQVKPWEWNMTRREAIKRHARGQYVSPDVLAMFAIGRGSATTTTRAGGTRTGRITTRRRTAAHRSARKASSSSGDDGGGEPPPPCRRGRRACGQVAASGFVLQGVKP
jgi:hypothetical protein